MLYLQRSIFVFCMLLAYTTQAAPSDFCKGKKDGAYKQKEQLIITCKASLPVKEQQYYKDNTLLSERILRPNGHMESQTRYYRNGQIETIQKFHKNGFLLSSKYFSTKGILQNEKLFTEAGDEEKKLYNPAGKLTSIQLYKKATLYSEEFYDEQNTKYKTVFYDKDGKIIKTKEKAKELPESDY